MGRCGRMTALAALAAIVLVAAPMAVAKSAEAAACNASITLPKDFCATVCRQGRTCPPNGGGRDGTLYVNTWSGADYGNDKPPAGGFLLAFKDTKGTGSADIKERFGASGPRAVMAAPASASTRMHFMPRSMTGSCAIPSNPAKRFRPPSPLLSLSNGDTQAGAFRNTAVTRRLKLTNVQNASVPSVQCTNPNPLSELNQWTIASVDADGTMATGCDCLVPAFRSHLGVNNSHHQSRADAVVCSSCIGPCSCSNWSNPTRSLFPSFCYAHNTFRYGQP